MFQAHGEAGVLDHGVPGMGIPAHGVRKGTGTIVRLAIGRNGRVILGIPAICRRLRLQCLERECFPGGLSRRNISIPDLRRLFHRHSIQAIGPCGPICPISQAATQGGHSLAGTIPDHLSRP